MAKTETKTSRLMTTEEKIDFLRLYGHAFHNVWEQHYPEFQICITDEENESMDKFMKLDKDEELVVENRKDCHKMLDGIIARVEREHLDWVKENRPKWLQPEWTKTIEREGSYCR